MVPEEPVKAAAEEEISWTAMTTLEDANIEEDPHQTTLPPPPPQNNNLEAAPDRNDDEVVATQWTFSIVYSETYGVPILYFQVQHLNGTPCPRGLVLQWLCWSHHSTTAAAKKEEEDASWEFTSQEEHPATGQVCFFLHPCRTASRLAALILSSNAGSNGDDEPSRKEAVGSSSRSTTITWSWMSMILPVVHGAIPPNVFRGVHEYMLHSAMRESGPKR